MEPVEVPPIEPVPKEKSSQFNAKQFFCPKSLQMNWLVELSLNLKTSGQGLRCVLLENHGSAVPTHTL